MNIEKIVTDLTGMTNTEKSKMEDWLGYLLSNDVEGCLSRDLHEGIARLSQYMSWDEEYFIRTRKFPSDHEELVPVKSFENLRGLTTRYFVRLNSFDELLARIEGGDIGGPLVSEIELSNSDLDKNFILVCGPIVKVRNIVRNKVPLHM